MRRIIAELGENISGPTRIWQDNQGTMKIANDFISNRRTKHIEIKFHYTREKITNGEIDVNYLPTSEMPADILTKPIGPIILEKMLTTFFGHNVNLRGSIKTQVEHHANQKDENGPKRLKEVKDDTIGIETHLGTSGTKKEGKSNEVNGDITMSHGDMGIPIP